MKCAFATACAIAIAVLLPTALTIGFAYTAGDAPYQVAQDSRPDSRLHALACGLLTGDPLAEDLVVGDDGGAVFVVADGGSRSPGVIPFAVDATFPLGTGHAALSTAFVTHRRDAAANAEIIAGGTDRVVVGSGFGSEAPAAVVFTSPGSQTFGTALAVTDAQNDGYDDVWIGDPAVERVYLMVGHTALQSRDILADDLSADVTVRGGGIGGVLASGDVTGDGAIDLLIGAPSGGAGSVFLIKGGRPLPAVLDLPADADAVFTGIDAGDLAGGSLTTADLDGDGTAEIIIGAAAAYAGGTGARGAIYVIWGQRDVTSRSLAAADVVFAGSPFHDFGSRLAAGDLNRDGFDDLVMLTAQEGGTAYYGRPRRFIPSFVTTYDRTFGWTSEAAAPPVLEGAAVMDRGGDGRDLVVSSQSGAASTPGAALSFYATPRAGTLSLSVAGIHESVVVGQALTTTVTVANSGASPVSWQLSLQQDAAGSWVRLPSVSGEAGAGATGSFQVTFATEVGMRLQTYTGTITVIPDGQPEQHWLSLPVSLTVTAAPPAPPPAPAPSPSGGFVELFLQDPASGDLAAWGLNGLTRIDARPLDPGRLARPTWRIAASGDFNRDGQPDLVWQEQTSGEIGVWIMNGPTRLWFEPFAPVSTAPTPAWKIAAVADLNGDQWPDLVWREENHGWLTAWLMRGVHQMSVVNLNPGTVDTAWEIAGAGDFNGDGHPDLLWRHTIDGLLSVRLMDGVDRLATVSLAPNRVIDLAWRIAAVVDVDADGRVDIVWQHDIDGSLYAWLMDGTARASGVALDPGTLDPRWRIAAAGFRAPRSALAANDLSARVVERVWGNGTAGSVIDSDDGWRKDGASMPSVVANGDELRMYFAGLEPTDNPYLYRARVGMMTSADGITFSPANGDHPVFGEGPPGAFDGHSVSHPAVVNVDTETGGSEWWMYYAAADGTVSATGVRIERVGLAKSADGITWHREPLPVLDIGTAGAIDSVQVASPFVLRAGRFFQMWYGAYGDAHRIAYATSTDGVHWVKRGAVRGLRGAAAGELGPAVYFDGREYVMFYNSVDDSHQWRTYVATSRDGMTWTAANDGRPLVGDAPPGTFAEAGPGRNSAVHLSEPVLVNGEWLAYYVGEDSRSVMRIGLLRFDQP